MSIQETADLTDRLIEFFEKYYRDEIGTLAQRYPKEQTSLYIEFADLYQYDEDIASDFEKNPSETRNYLEEALRLFDLPADVNLSGATVRVTDSRGYLERVKLGDVRDTHIEGTGYYALRCQIGKVTGVKYKVTEAAFECQRCGTMTYIPQTEFEFQTPHECQGCERQGPFSFDESQSELVNHRKLKLEEPPEEQVNGAGDELVAYVDNDLVEVGGENGLQDRAGSRVTVIGEFGVDASDLFSRGKNEPVVEEYFVPQAFVFDDDDDEELEIDEHRDDVKRFASRDDAVDVFRHSIDPGLTLTPKWDIATEMATAYLFAAPRINPDDGDMVRGDLHMLFVSDPGMRKSVFAECVAELSPQGEIREATGMASDVGLTAAAQRDDFGDGQWSLSPGALPRANGGHLIIDEIDKGPGLGGIHGCLEGQQQLKVDKAGMQATLATRVGFMALGNPVDGRFDPHEPIAEQIDLDPALMSRFDLIVTMQDAPDEEMDGEIADGILDSIDESARIEYGELDAENADAVKPEVPRDVMKAWVAIGRELAPLLTDAAKSVLREYYVDTRQLNGEDSEKPPATARTLVGGVRLAMAFARCELSETVEESHAQRAVKLSKTVVGNNFDAETGEFDADRTTEAKSSQESRKKRIKNALTDDPQTTAEVAATADIDENIVAEELRTMKNQTKTNVIEPTKGEWRKV